MKDGAAAPGEDMDVRSLEPSGETGSSEGETTWKVDGREFLIHKHNLHTPFPIFSSSGILQKETWQGRIVYNQSQKDILQEWFKQNPYPDKATRKQRAKEIGIPESKIQIWFKNHRAKQRRLQFGCSFGKNKTQGQHQYQPWTQEYLPKAARQDWTPITRSQSHTLVQAFERNQFPDITTRKKLANKMGIQEPRIQTWFQNQRSLHPGQSRSESMNSLADGPNGRPEKCQNHKEQSGIGILQLKDYSQPHPEDQKHQLQDLEQVDISYILERWDNVRQALIAKWDPGEGTH
nr:double homeobox B [Vulpes vulpes]